MDQPSPPGEAVAARQRVRLASLRSLVEEGGPMRLGEAARVLGVSSMTLRRDLANPATGLDLLGGHIMVQNGLGTRSAYSLAAESDSHASAKRQAAERAAALVEPGDTIFIDCGTTMPYLAAALRPDLGITIVCYALNIAVAACQLADAQLFLLGGVFHPSSATFFSEEALRGLSRISITKAFLSAGGMHDSRGASCSNFNEVPVKRAVMRRAMRSFLVIDSSKLGSVKPAHFAAADAFERIVTELA
ncbi:MAG: DeoR/GlpR family DNA-binding transcription regulator [Janthinobacterium lividum]